MAPTGFAKAEGRAIGIKIIQPRLRDIFWHATSMEIRGYLLDLSQTVPSWRALPTVIAMRIATKFIIAWEVSTCLPSSRRIDDLGTSKP